MGNDEKLRRTRLLTQIHRLLDEYQDSWSAEETEGGILISFNAAPAAAAEPEQADDAEDSEVILTALTVADLRTLAEAEGIDLAGIDRKAEIIEAIEAARAGETAEQD